MKLLTLYKQLINESTDIILKHDGNRYETKDEKAFIDIEKYIDTWHIVMIESRIKGFGSLLINRIIRDAKKSGVKKITLTAINGSVDFFKKFGFKVINYGDNDILMELILK